MSAIIKLCAVILPLLMVSAGLASVFKKNDVFESFKTGAFDGMLTIAKLLPTLCGLFCAVYMLRASGVFDTLSHFLEPVLDKLGIPGELTPLILMRPFSGSGALAISTEIMKNAGVDSMTGRMAAVMLSSSETTLYTAGVYFGASGVTRTRYALFAAFCAELTSIAVSAVAVRWFWA
jgi:spore maturation protein B